MYVPPIEWSWAIRSNCYAFTEAYLGVDLPSMDTVQKTATGLLGDVAVFNYSGTPHVAVVLYQNNGSFRIRESNFGGDYVGERDISFYDPQLIGFLKL